MVTLQNKDRRRLNDSVTRLHTITGRQWDTEDRVHGALLSAVHVADYKREIDQLNVLAGSGQLVPGRRPLAVPDRQRQTRVHGQCEELCAALDSLVSDVAAGRRRCRLDLM
ncbi:hypothetical protein BIV24_26510 [Streptomyces colonosanans]|uniref:Uncharacterized protein n=2 Tax=Streptomyces colonosanans TaxID=1428652 RepID=A0A1S2NY65_9ACTN|nr:hypothetical protein BIV24_26510 [Streptomyces colonosanans]